MQEIKPEGVKFLGVIGKGIVAVDQYANTEIDFPEYEYGWDNPQRFLPFKAKTCYKLIQQAS